jgi:DNA-directed RNA polymerase subunit beta'
MNSQNFLNLKNTLKQYKKIYLTFDYIYLNIASQFNIQAWANKIRNNLNPYYIEIKERYFNNCKKKHSQKILSEKNIKKKLKLKAPKNLDIFEKEHINILKMLTNIDLLLKGKYKSKYYVKKEKKNLFSLKWEYLCLKKVRKNQSRLKTELSILSEISEPDLIDPRTSLPYNEGLFCQRIFGPIKVNICECQKYFNCFYKKSCNVCSVELGDPRVRRYRLGVINLNFPLIHSWFLDYLHFIVKDEQDYIFLTKHFIKKLIFCQKHSISFLDEIYFKAFFLSSFKSKKKYISYDYSNFSKKFYSFKYYNKLITISTTKKYIFKNKETFLNTEFWYFNYLAKDIKKKKTFEISQSHLFFKKKFNNELIAKNSQASFISSITNTFGINLFIPLLKNLELDKEIEICRNLIYKLKESSTKNYFFIAKKIRILESFFFTKNSICSLITNSISVLPPAYRPVFYASKPEKVIKNKNTTQFLSSHLNSIYGDIIKSNTSFAKEFDKISNFKLIKVKEIKKLQELVDSLFNGSNKRSSLFTLEQNKSLTKFLIGKEGFFRANVLGKRVNYSARSVIVPGPNLKFNQCGIPFFILKKLFKFELAIIFDLYKSKNNNTQILDYIKNQKSKKSFYSKLNFASDYLEKQKNKFQLNTNFSFLKKDFSFFFFFKNLVKNYSILLNRAPTLHKYGIQAFDIKPILGYAVQLHPLLCTVFNADFDGDQMGIHLPLYNLTQLEIKSKLRPSANFFSQRNGDSLIKPTQDMIIGYYYLTYSKCKNLVLRNKIYKSSSVALSLYFEKKIFLNDIILLKNNKICNFLRIIKKKICFFDNNFSLKNSPIKIYKTYKSKQKRFLLTELGILVMNKINKRIYKLNDCFYQTTPGRLILENLV